MIDSLADRYKIKRRALLETGSVLLAAGTTLGLGGFISPREAQAWIQTTDRRLPVWGKAIDSAVFDRLHGKLFRFEEG